MEDTEICDKQLVCDTQLLDEMHTGNILYSHCLIIMCFHSHFTVKKKVELRNLKEW